MINFRELSEYKENLVNYLRNSKFKNNPFLDKSFNIDSIYTFSVGCDLHEFEDIRIKFKKKHQEQVVRFAEKDSILACTLAASVIKSSVDFGALSVLRINDNFIEYNFLTKDVVEIFKLLYENTTNDGNEIIITFLDTYEGARAFASHRQNIWFKIITDFDTNDDESEENEFQYFHQELKRWGVASAHTNPRDTTTEVMVEENWVDDKGNLCKKYKIVAGRFVSETDKNFANSNGLDDSRDFKPRIVTERKLVDDGSGSDQGATDSES